jgi:hypothetical protein
MPRQLYPLDLRSPSTAVYLMLAFLGSSSVALGQTLSSSETLAISLSPTGVIYSVPTSLTLSSAGTFASYIGSLSLSSEVRTSSSGSAAITLQATSDFSPTTGPLVSGGKLSYQCSAASYGTACSGTISASTTSQTSVASFSSLSCTGGGSPCSGSDPNTITLQFTVPDQATYKTGSYTATITFTISAS